ncbi:MAG TPA: IS21 family transposase [Acidimicrobiales bacterium]|nr:IS21 family transposase [Acidimicrobiales bacterium]
MKNERERMEIIAAFNEVGTLRGAAAMCGCDPKTVKRALERPVGAQPSKRAERARNYDVVRDLVAQRVERTRARISAKRLLAEARAAGYSGSARNFRRLVAKAKSDWRRDHHRGRRPAVWSPGETLVIDWGSEGPLQIFCAVLGWSRVRFVRFAADQRAETTLRLLAECFEALGGVPKVVLADRMGCLKAGVVANVVVPAPDYVRFATHYRFRPDFCEGGDPESKGIVENLVGYAKSDLVVPAGLDVADLAGANEWARAWCAEVNAAVHSEIAAVPAERLLTELRLLGELPSLRPTIGRAELRRVDRLATIRIGGARYSVPKALKGARLAVVAGDGRIKILDGDQIVADHAVVGPGEASIVDDHYGGPRPDRPRRAPRPRTEAQRAFLGLGPAAEAFLKGAAAAGMTKIGAELEELAGLEAAHGPQVLITALERAVAFGRWRAADVRSILAAGTGTPTPTAPGQALLIPLPLVPTRPLSDYAIRQGS